MGFSKRKTFPKQVKFAVWENNCGKVYSHKCHIHYCSIIMTVKDFECGHIVAHAKGGRDTLSNLLPICNKCNKSMGTMSIPEYNGKLDIAGNTPAPIKQQINDYHSDFEEALLGNKNKKNKWTCCFR